MLALLSADVPPLPDASTVRVRWRPRPRHGASTQAEGKRAVLTDDRFEQNRKEKVAGEARQITVAP